MSIEDFDQKKFIKKVRKFMKDKKLSVRRFSQLSGTSFATLYRLERDENEITFATIRKLQQAMEGYKDQA